MPRRRVTVAVVVLLALAGCLSQPARPGAGAPAGTPTPVELLAIWRVTGAEGEGEETWLRFDVHDFQLWRGRSMLTGAWAATETLLVTGIYGATGADAETALQDPPAWLDGVHELRRTGEGWELLDDDGAVTATLTADGTPEPIPSAAELFAEPPVVTDDVRERLAERPRRLPDGLSPATPEALAGRWVPESPRPNDPHVIFEADDTWEGSDGCNGGQGAWALADAGRLLTTGGPTTLIGCEGADVPGWVTLAARAGLDGETLVLLDRDGDELGRLRRG